MPAEPRILCFGPNPALDITYETDGVELGASHRIETVHTRAGGKATNIARIVQALGGRARLVAPIGGHAGDVFAEDVDDSDIGLRIVAVPGETRRSIVVVESSDRTTLFNEAGPAWSVTVWPHLLEVLTTEVKKADAVALTGSLPPGCPPEILAEVVQVCVARGVPVLVDASGEALTAAITAGATMVKPNRTELKALTDKEGVAGCLALRGEDSDVTVVASDGEAGLVAVSSEGTWRARPGEPVQGNPTGAGEALVAALVMGLATGKPLEESLRLGIGSAGAAVLEPVAGRIDSEKARTLSDVAVVEAIDPE